MILFLKERGKERDIGWRWSKDNVRWFSAENVDVSYARKTKFSVFMRNLHIFRGDIYLSKKIRILLVDWLGRVLKKV